MTETLTYILVISGTTFLVRALPFLLLRKPIKSKFIRSFLAYIPYVTLAAMAFPDMVFATGNWISGLAGFLAALTVAWLKGSLIKVTGIACLVVLMIEIL